MIDVPLFRISSKTKFCFKISRLCKLREVCLVSKRLVLHSAVIQPTRSVAELSFGPWTLVWQSAPALHVYRTTRIYFTTTVNVWMPPSLNPKHTFYVLTAVSDFVRISEPQCFSRLSNQSYAPSQDCRREAVTSVFYTLRVGDIPTFHSHAS